MKAVALVVLALAAIAGCGSTVYLGSLPTTDMARPTIDIAMQFPSDGFLILDMGPDGASDLGVVDLSP